MSKSNGVWVTSRDPDFDLADVGTKPPKGAEKESVVAAMDPAGARLEELFDLMTFAGSHALLIVLQGMDASGKDGTIRHLLKHCHAQNCRVASFKVPTAQELAHDFLWRCHAETPGKGGICIFNRSHYEDVGVVRVHNLVDEKVWGKRYGHIRNFEECLTDSNTIVIKIFLHISEDEQFERLNEREADPDAAWKLSVGDWQEREHWDAYQSAYSAAIGECAAKHAPWLVVPADKKWWRNHVVTEALTKTLEPYEKGWRDDLERIGAKAKAELAAFREGN